METKNLKTRYLFLLLLILWLSISFSSSSLAATVTGTVTMTCDTYTTGKIYVILESSVNYAYIDSVTLDAPGPYTLTVDDSHLGENVFIIGQSVKDVNNWFSIGDCVTWGAPFQLAAENTVDVDLNRKITASVSGDITCDDYTTGSIIPMIVGPSGQSSNYGPVFHGPGPYTTYVLDLPLGTPVLVFGYWNVDGSGSMTYGDYMGWYTGSSGNKLLPITLEEENTGIDVNISHKYVADISGTITCSQSTSGSGYVSLYDGPDPNTANNIVKFGTPPPLPFPGSYYYMIFDVNLGTKVWVFGYWDKDGSGSKSPGDYIGSYPGNPITLQQVNTGIDFNVCEGLDTDGDWVTDNDDQCPQSNLAPTITIGECDTGVKNQVSSDGCSMNDQIDQCGGNAKNRRQFLKCVTRLTKDWQGSGLITGKERKAILKCAAKADIP
ncbi:MAG: hypothetical protein NT096_09465 [Proteobacteria bacterium]|nr:hypothetical protein [Pseudomonadota bacterium]